MNSRLYVFRLRVSSLDKFSDAVWQLPGVQGLEESPLDGGGLFAIHADFEILEFGSEAAQRAAAWLEREEYRGRHDILVKVYVDAEQDPLVDATFASQMAARFEAQLISSCDLVSQDYLANYRAQVKGVRLSEALWMGPPWQAEGVDAEHKFIVEPGLAFGTGDHPTTQLCLTRLFEMKEQRLRPARVLDLGTGSGVLAVAAQRFFPDARVLATDLDPVCEQELARTVALNSSAPISGAFGVGGTAAAVRATGARFDLIVSNIYAEVLAGLVGDLHALLLPGGRWMASGILAGGPEDLLRAATEPLFRCELRRTQVKAQATLESGRGLQKQDEVWVLLEFTRKE